MKRFRRYIERLLPAVAVLTLVSCSLDELDEPKKPTNQSGQWGSLVIESLTVNTDNEHLDRGSNSATRTDGENGNGYRVPNPNGVEENLNNYWIEVFDADGEVVDINGDTQGTGMTYADVTALNTGEGTEVTLINGSKLKLKGIVLPPGEYTVWAYKDATKGASIPNVLAEDESPDTNQTTPAYYMGHNTVTVVSAEDLEGNATSTPVEITCKLAQTLVTVEMSADMLEWFDETNSLGVMAKAGDTDAAPALQTIVTIEPEEPEENETYSYVFPYNSNHGVETTTVEGESAVTTISGGPFVYFKDHAGANGSGNTMVFKMEGVYLNVSIDNLQKAIADLEANGKDSGYYKNLTYVSMEREIKGVRAAQWRRISIDIDHNTEGDVQFEVTIDSYVFDETIDVDVQTLFFSTNTYHEEEVPDIDPSAPSVQFNIPVDDDEAVIAKDGYDTQMGKWNANLQMTVTPSNNTTIKEVYAVISSDNSDLMAALEKAGYTEGRVTLYSGVSTLADADTEVSYFVVDDPATTEPNIVVKLSDHGMTALQNSYRGTHNIKVWTKDSEDRMKYTDLVIKSGDQTGCNIGTATGGGSGSGEEDSGVGPIVTWTHGSKTTNKVTISQTDYPMNSTGYTPIKAAIASETGITGLRVKIISDILDADELGGFGLAQEMDLLEPANAGIETALRGLGFIPIESGNKEDSGEDDDYRIFNPATGEKKEDAVSPLLNEKEIVFEITEFMPMLVLLAPDEGGPAVHTFELYVTDESGTRKSTMEITCTF